MSILNVNQLQPVGGGNTITVGSSNIDYSGSITGNISVDGNLTVTGVVSNEDVTNIDSVGVVTARAGINISGGNLQVGGTNVINSGRALYNLEQIKLSDTKEIVLGSNDDLKIYHSGSHSFISEEGAGALKIKGDDIRFETAGGTSFVNTTSAGQITVGGAVFNYQGTSKPYNNNAGTLWGTANIALTGQWSSINWPSDHSDPEPSQPWYMMGRPHGSTDKWTLGIRPGSSNSIYDIIECDNDSNGYISSLKFHTSNGQERLRIRSDGKISAGTAINTTNTYEFSVTGADGTGAFYAHGRNHYLSNRSNAYSSLTLKKANADSDGIDYLQLRDSSNILKGQITGAGNWKPASGGGIDFSAFGNAGGMTSELLDDYEEGTFTPTWGNGSAAYSSPVPTYNTQYGHYTKIGNVVTYDIHLVTTAWNGAGSVMWIYGLPFTTRSSIYQHGGGSTFCIEGVDSQNAINNLTTQIAPNNTRIELYYQTPATGANYNTFGTNNVSEGNQVNIRVSGFYYTNS